MIVPGAQGPFDPDQITKSDIGVSRKSQSVPLQGKESSAGVGNDRRFSTSRGDFFFFVSFLIGAIGGIEYKRKTVLARASFGTYKKHLNGILCGFLFHFLTLRKHSTPHIHYTHTCIYAN